MKRSAVLVGFTLLYTSTAFAVAGEADSFCASGTQIEDTTYWRVDDQLPAELNNVSFGTIDLTYPELLNAVDSSLQNFARQSRGKMRARVINALPSSCSGYDNGNTTPCIVGHSNVDVPLADNVCAANPGFVAHGGCSADKGCRVVFCLDNMPGAGDLDWTSGRSFVRFMHHELGHNYGLNHVNPACATSDGCESEVMCSALSNGRSSHFEHGDNKGLRLQYNAATGSFTDRKVFSGSRAEGGTSVTFSTSQMTVGNHATGPLEAMFAPRITCPTFDNTKMTCAAIAVEAVGADNFEARVLVLDDWSSTGWGIIDSINTIGGRHAMPPDITANNTGDFLFVTTVSEVNHNTFIHRIDAATGARISASLGYASVLPPRVVYNEDISAALVVAAVPDADDADGAAWRLTRVTYNAVPNTLTPTNLDFGFVDNNGEQQLRHIASDFDFDCRDVVVGTDTCVLVAHLHDDSVAGREPGMMASVAFSVASNGTVTMTPANDWTFSEQQDQQATVGVTLMANRLAISHGRRVTDSSANTRAIEFTGTSVAGASFFTSFTHRGDAETCATATRHGFTLGASTAHGGYDTAWCATCNSGAGRVESLHFGKQEGGSDYCF